MNLVRPLEFGLHCVFLDREDRSQDDFNPGRFFRFDFFGGNLPFLVQDNALWSNPPSEGVICLLRGIIRSNTFCDLQPYLKSVVLPGDDGYYEPSSDVFFDGCPFRGIARIDKSVARSKSTNEDYYRFTVRSFGLLTSYTVSRDVYDAYPSDIPIFIEGLLNCNQTYDMHRNRRIVSWSMSLGKYKDIAASRQGQNAEKPAK